MFSMVWLFWLIVALEAKEKWKESWDAARSFVRPYLGYPGKFAFLVWATLASLPMAFSWFAEEWPYVRRMWPKTFSFVAAAGAALAIGMLSSRIPYGKLQELFPDIAPWIIRLLTDHSSFIGWTLAVFAGLLVHECLARWIPVPRRPQIPERRRMELVGNIGKKNRRRDILQKRWREALHRH